MPVIDILNKTEVKTEPRIQMLSGIFDCPINDANIFELHDNLEIESFDWNIGLICGASGCGKSSILKQIGDIANFEWDTTSVITSFSKEHSIQDITDALNSVGFSNIRAWMRPFNVLSNGEQFRAFCARAILEAKDIIYLDEFTSVVDRQVAQIASHAIQKFLRRNNKKMICASCHSDIIDWLQPDWVYEPQVKKFTRRSLCRRPESDVKIYETNYKTWHMFAPYHYMSAELNHAAKCYVLTYNDNPAAFAAMLHRPISAKGNHVPIWGCSRLVTLPDYQGLGLAFILIDFVGEYYARLGKRVRTYPAHPLLVKNFYKNEKWRNIQKYTPRRAGNKGSEKVKWVGDRCCAVFEYKLS